MKIQEIKTIIKYFIFFSVIMMTTEASSNPVTSAHPRIWLTEEVLTELRVKVTQNTSQWQEFKSACDYVLSSSGVWAADMYIPDLALAYQVLKDIDPVLAHTYAAKAIDLMNQISYFNIATDSGYYIRYHGRHLAIGYDWLYDELAPEEREHFYTTLNSWLDWFSENGYARNNPGDNYFTGYFVTIGLTGYATYGDNPRAQEWIDYSRDLYDNMVVPQLSVVLKGGDWLEGWNYAPLSVVNYTSYMEAVRTATQENLFSGFTYPKEVISYKLHALHPDWNTVYDGGSWTGDRKAFTSLDDVALLSSVFSGTTEGSHIHFYRSHLKNYWGFPFKYDQWYQFLWYNPDAPEEDYTFTSPLSYRAEGTGIVFMRSDWGEEATWASFQSGYNYEEGDMDQGHFEIYKNGLLVVDEGQVGKADNSRFSNHHNTFLIDDQGKHLTYALQQGVWGREVNIARYENTTEYAYVLGDITDAYNQPTWYSPRINSVSNFKRHFLFLRPGSFIIFDRISTLEAGYAKTWVAHLISEPSNVGAQFSVENVGGGKLFFQSLLPEGAIYNTRLDGNGKSWRYTIDSPTSQQDELFLNVLFACDVDTTSMPAVTLLKASSDNMAGAQIASSASSPQWLVMFAKNEEDISSVTFGVSGTGTAKFLICDLKKQTDYNVKKNGSLLLTKPASAEGNLYFETTISTNDTFAIQETHATGDTTRYRNTSSEKVRNPVSFRDRYLLSNKLVKAAVNFYYRVRQKITNYIKRK